MQVLTLMLHCIVSCAILGLLVIPQSHVNRAFPAALLLVYGTYLHDKGTSSSLTNVAIHIVLFTICCYTARSLSGCLVHRVSAFAQRSLGPLKIRRAILFGGRSSSDISASDSQDSSQGATPSQNITEQVQRQWDTSMQTTCQWCSNPTVIAIAATVLLEIGHTLVAVIPRQSLSLVADVLDAKVASLAETGIAFIWRQATVISSMDKTPGIAGGAEDLQQVRLSDSSAIMGMFLLCCLIATVFKLLLLIISMGKDPRHPVYSLALQQTAEQLQELRYSR